jgi:4-hydroxy-4-methyl-2-oxoglutarate aldolase
MTGVVARTKKRAEPEAMAALGKHGVSTTHEAMGRAGLMKPYMRPMYPGAQIAGGAVTVLAQPGGNWMIHVAIEQIMPGDVLVVACTTDSTNDMFGDLLATSLRARGRRPRDRCWRTGCA